MTRSPTPSVGNGKHRSHEYQQQNDFATPPQVQFLSFSRLLVSQMNHTLNNVVTNLADEIIICFRHAVVISLRILLNREFQMKGTFQSHIEHEVEQEKGIDQTIRI